MWINVLQGGPQPEILACRSVGCSSETRKHHTAHINTSVLYFFVFLYFIKESKHDTIFTSKYYMQKYVKHALSCMHASILARWRDCIVQQLPVHCACMQADIRELRTCYVCIRLHVYVCWNSVRIIVRQFCRCYRPCTVACQPSLGMNWHARNLMQL